MGQIEFFGPPPAPRPAARDRLEGRSKHVVVRLEQHGAQARIAGTVLLDLQECPELRTSSKKSFVP